MGDHVKLRKLYFTYLGITSSIVYSFLQYFCKPRFGLLNHFTFHVWKMCIKYINYINLDLFIYLFTEKGSRTTYE